MHLFSVNIYKTTLTETERKLPGHFYKSHDQSSKAKK